MPLFMVISGYFMSFTLSRKSLYQAIKDKVTMILLPTLIWGLIITYGKSVGPLYFLWAIFYSSLIMSILCIVVKSNVLRSIICVIIVISLNFAPFTWSNMSYLFPFFALGYFYNELDVRIPKMGGVLPFLFIILLCFWDSSYNIWTTGTYFNELNISSISIVLFRYMIGIVGCYTFIVTASFFYDGFSKNRNWLFDFFCKSGKETLAIYILQDIILFKFLKNATSFMAAKIGYNPFLLNESFMGYVIAPVFALLVMYLSYKTAIKLKSWKLTKYVFGGKF